MVTRHYRKSTTNLLIVSKQHATSSLCSDVGCPKTKWQSFRLHRVLEIFNQWYLQLNTRLITERASAHTGYKNVACPNMAYKASDQPTDCQSLRKLNLNLPAYYRFHTQQQQPFKLPHWYFQIGRFQLVSSVCVHGMCNSLNMQNHCTGSPLITQHLWHMTSWSSDITCNLITMCRSNASMLNSRPKRHGLRQRAISLQAKQAIHRLTVNT